jgi:dihydroorotase
MIGLQTAFAVVKTAVPELTAERITDLFSTNARRIFNLGASIAKDQKACITLFDPDQKWSFDLSQNRSRSSNTAFTGITLTGKPVGIINKGSLFLS